MMHGSWARGLVFVMPIELEKETKDYNGFFA